MKKAKTLTSAFVIIALMGSYALSEILPKPQITCPVMGGKIDKNVYADHEGKRIYFCCQACITQFKKDPAKYIKKLEDAGVVLEKTPSKDSQNIPGQSNSKGCCDCVGYS